MIECSVLKFKKFMKQFVHVRNQIYSGVQGGEII